MANTPNRATAGGFFPPALPSPTPSTASSRAAAGLPHPRSKPLLPGSRKEDYARDYVSRRLLHVSRRYVKKHGIPDPADLVSAYKTFDEVCKDLDEVVDVLWFSGTPSLQVPYLLNIALAITEYLPAFPPSPRPTFALLSKLDHCFASLLSGYDIKTHAPLSGFERGLSVGLSRTDMVRCRSLADETRMQIALKMSSEADVDTAMFPEDDPVAPPPRSSTKRKAEDSDDDADNGMKEESSMQSATPPKRQRTESPRIKREDSPNGIFHAEGGSSSATKGQFHWAIDADESDDEQEGNGDQIMTDILEQRLQRTPPLSAEPESNAEDPPDQNYRRRRDEESDEEDEELHMSVTKVYEKTITELGRTLGETLVDD